MKSRLSLCLLAGLGFTTLLARLDEEARSFADLVRLENVPAFGFYTLGFAAIFFVLFAWRRQTEPVRVEARTSSDRPRS